MVSPCPPWAPHPGPWWGWGGVGGREGERECAQIGPRLAGIGAQCHCPHLRADQVEGHPAVPQARTRSLLWGGLCSRWQRAALCMSLTRAGDGQCRHIAGPWTTGSTYVTGSPGSPQVLRPQTERPSDPVAGNPHAEAPALFWLPRPQGHFIGGTGHLGLGIGEGELEPTSHGCQRAGTVVKFWGSQRYPWGSHQVGVEP